MSRGRHVIGTPEPPLTDNDRRLKAGPLHFVNFAKRFSTICSTHGARYFQARGGYQPPMTWVVAERKGVSLHRFLRLDTPLDACCRQSVEQRHSANRKPKKECCRDAMKLFNRAEGLAGKLKKLHKDQLADCCKKASNRYDWWLTLEKAAGVQLLAAPLHHGFDELTGQKRELPSAPAARWARAFVTILYRTNWQPITSSDPVWLDWIKHLRSLKRHDLVEAAESAGEMAIPWNRGDVDQRPKRDDPTALPSFDPAIVSDADEFVRSVGAIYRGMGGQKFSLGRNGGIAPSPSLGAVLAHLWPGLPPHIQDPKFHSKRLREATGCFLPASPREDREGLAASKFARHAREVLAGRRAWIREPISAAMSEVVWGEGQPRHLLKLQVKSKVALRDRQPGKKFNAPARRNSDGQLEPVDPYWEKQVDAGAVEVLGRPRAQRKMKTSKSRERKNN
jgi:hypothetical protein